MNTTTQNQKLAELVNKFLQPCQKEQIINLLNNIENKTPVSCACEDNKNTIIDNKEQNVRIEKIVDVSIINNAKPPNPETKNFQETVTSYKKIQKYVSYLEKELERHRQLVKDAYLN